MKYFVKVTIVALIGLLSCQKSSDGTSRIRVENMTDQIFDEVKIWSISHGSLDPGDLSQYTLVEQMYDKVSVTVSIDTLQFSQIVIDYVGEEPLKAGDFTLQVDILDISDPWSMTQNLIRD